MVNVFIRKNQHSMCAFDCIHAESRYCGHWDKPTFFVGECVSSVQVRQLSAVAANGLRKPLEPS